MGGGAHQAKKVREWAAAMDTICLGLSWRCCLVLRRHLRCREEKVEALTDAYPGELETHQTRVGDILHPGTLFRHYSLSSGPCEKLPSKELSLHLPTVD
jgi:hypothetical protein